MRNAIIIILSLFSFILFNSCREDGDWGIDNQGQFGFTIERDNNFIEKAVGEINQLKFNVQPSYDFQSIKTSFKFTTSLNGILKLNGELLTANQEYDFAAEENIFEYVGNVSGIHELKIVVKNGKGTSKEEGFSLPYSISDFSHTYNGGTGSIYQGDETQYLMKIIPGSGQPSTGYQIKFETYSGQVKLNGVEANVGTWYPINNIDSFTTSLETNTPGQGKLSYSIKNNTLSKDYEIQQNIIAREVTIESINFNPANISINTQITLTGIVKKSPVNTNTTIQYKTWISSASNSNLNGIQNTNNTYTNYALGSNGSFLSAVNALVAGTYTYNIQVKDEYGNESAVKTFNVVVEDFITFEGNQSAELLLVYAKNTAIYQKGFNRSLNIKAGGTSVITNIDYILSYDLKSDKGLIRNFTFNYNEPANSNSNAIELNGFFNTNNASINFSVLDNADAINRTLKVKATSSTGQTKEITIVPSFDGLTPL